MNEFFTGDTNPSMPYLDGNGNYKASYYTEVLKNKMKMERKEVYERINGERDYQDWRWNSNLRPNDVPDEEKPIAEWLNYIEYHLSKAKVENYHLNYKKALDELRKVAALTVRAMEIHGCPERKIDTNDKSCCDDNCNCKK